MHKKLVFGRYDIAAFLCFFAYAACSNIIPVSLVPIAISLDFPLNEGGTELGGILQLGRSTAMVVTMLYCGFLAGRFGKTRAIGMSIICMSFGIILASISPLYGILFLALIIAGLGEGIIEGLATPIVQDLHPNEPGRYINFTHAFWSIGVVGTTLAAGALLFWGVHWRIIVCATGILSLIPAVMFLVPGKTKFPKSDERYNASQVWRNTVHILKQKRFWLFFAAMFVAGGAEFCLTFWTPAFITEECGGTLWHAGFGTALFGAGMILGRIGSGYLVSQKRLRELIIVSLIAATVISAFIPMLSSLWALFILLFMIGIMTGPHWPSIQSYASTRMTVDNTMLFVLLSCSGVPGCGFFTMLLGISGKYIGLRSSFYLVPVCFFLATIFVVSDWLFNRRKLVKRLSRRNSPASS